MTGKAAFRQLGYAHSIGGHTLLYYRLWGRSSFCNRFVGNVLYTEFQGLSDSIEPPVNAQPGVLAGAQDNFARRPGIFDGIVMSKCNTEVTRNGCQIPPAPVSLRPSAAGDHCTVQPPCSEQPQSVSLHCAIHVAVSISADSSGVAAPETSRLFRKFSLVSSRLATDTIGGEDLAPGICKGIVEAHGGRIWADTGEHGRGMTLTFERRVVTVAGHQVQLTATEYNLLFELSTKAGRVLTQDELLERVWGPEFLGQPEVLHSYVRSLRQKLGNNASSPSYIFTEHGIGYRMAQA